MTVPAALAGSVILGHSIIVGDPKRPLEQLNRSINNLLPSGEEAMGDPAKAAEADNECQRKQKELKEWDLIEVDRRGKTTLKTIKSDRPKDRFWSLEKFDGMAMVDEPLVRVRHKDSEVVFTEEQKKRMAEVAKEMKKDGDKEFVVL